MSNWLPEPPTDVPEHSGAVSLRYEDVAQDGRLTIAALPHALGEVTWPAFMAELGERVMRDNDGAVPILTRFVMLVGDGPISVLRPLNGTTRYQLAHTVDAAGEVNRLLLLMWVDLFGRRGTTHGFVVAGEGDALRVGRVFAEHVITRPFAAAGARKVLQLKIAGMPGIPPLQVEWRSPRAAGELPASSVALDDSLVQDAAAIRLGVGHTDSNQHVNSLVYPRLFEDAALRHLARHGATGTRARDFEIAYRKPCFAGEEVRIWLRAFRSSEGMGVTGCFAPEGGDPIESARCHCRIRFD